MKKLMVLMLDLLLCAYSTSENKEKETPKEDPKNENTVVSFVGVGGNLTHEVICKRTDAAAGEMNDGRYDFTEMYTHVKKDIQKTDLVYIDQESIVGRDTLGISGHLTFDTPADITKNVADIGFDIVDTASNHCLDKYQEGTDYSHKIWAKRRGITTAGTYTSQKDWDTTRIIKRRRITFSFLAYTHGTNRIEPPNPYSAAYLDEDQIRENTKKAKQLSSVVIVSAHWGDGSASTSMESQKKYTKLLADLDVDTIVGEHPHAIQPAAQMDGKGGNKTLIIYSLGNFLNGMLDVNNALGGTICFDLVKDAKGNEISIQNVRREPLIIYYIGNAAGIMNTRRNFIVCRLDDCNEELVEWHGLNGVDRQKVRLNDLYARTKKAITEISVIEKGDMK